LQPPSSFLSEAVAHMQKMLAGGNDAVYSFRELIMLLLRKTILDHRSFVSVQSVDWKTAFVIAPPPRNPADFATAAEGSELYSSLKLTNGYFLDLHYTVFIDSKDKYLKVDSSRMVYQSDDAGRDQFFRFEMDRKPKTHYPFAHLHVNGNWKAGTAQRPKDLEKIHFPIARPTIENLIRVLVYDFGVKPQSEPSVFEPVLRACEQEFLKIARTSAKEPQPLPPKDD
jgi:hypothetical protein